MSDHLLMQKQTSPANTTHDPHVMHLNQIKEIIHEATKSAPTLYIWIYICLFIPNIKTLYSKLVASYNII